MSKALITQNFALNQCENEPEETAGQDKFLLAPPLPHQCGVPPGDGTPHLCGSEELCRAPESASVGQGVASDAAHTCRREIWRAQFSG